MTLAHKKIKVKPQRLVDSNGIKLHIARIVATTFTGRNPALRIGENLARCGGKVNRFQCAGFSTCYRHRYAAG